MADLVAATACNGTWAGRTFDAQSGVDAMSMEFAEFVLAHQEAWNAIPNGTMGGDVVEDGCLGPLTARTMGHVMRQTGTDFEAWRATISAWLSRVVTNWQEVAPPGGGNGGGAIPPPTSPLPPPGGGSGGDDGGGGMLLALGLLGALFWLDK